VIGITPIQALIDLFQGQVFSFSCIRHSRAQARPIGTGRSSCRIAQHVLIGSNANGGIGQKGRGPRIRYSSSPVNIVVRRHGCLPSAMELSQFAAFAVTSLPLPTEWLSGATSSVPYLKYRWAFCTAAIGVVPALDWSRCVSNRFQWVYDAPDSEVTQLPS